MVSRQLGSLTSNSHTIFRTISGNGTFCARIHFIRRVTSLLRDFFSSGTRSFRLNAELFRRIRRTRYNVTVHRGIIGGRSAIVNDRGIIASARHMVTIFHGQVSGNERRVLRHLQLFFLSGGSERVRSMSRRGHQDSAAYFCHRSLVSVHVPRAMGGFFYRLVGRRKVRLVIGGTIGLWGPSQGASTVLRGALF